MLKTDSCCSQESTVVEYQERFVRGGYNAQAASGAEIQYFRGQDFGPLGEGRSFRQGQSLLLGFGHRNSGLFRARQDPKTRDLPTVVGAVEKGIVKPRVWKSTAPQDVCEKVAEQGNESHGGAGNAWPQLLRMTKMKVDDGWFCFKQKLRRGKTEVMDIDAQHAQVAQQLDSQSSSQPSEHATPDKAIKLTAHEEYELMWKFVRPRWGHHYSGKQQLTDVRSINRRLTTFGAFDIIMQDASRFGDWTGTTMNTAKVIRGLLVATQCFETIYASSLPRDDFVIQLRTFCRLCYPNQPQEESEIDSRYGLWCCDSPEDAQILWKILNCKMTQSAVYKNSTIKDRAVAAPKDKARQSRSQQAAQQRNEQKEKVVTPTEHMDLTIVTADGLSRDKYWLEDLVTHQRAGHKSSDQSIDATKREEILLRDSLAVANFAATIASNPMRDVKWHDKTFKTWMHLRKESKYWITKELNSVAMAESADQAESHIKDMVESKTSARPLWQDLLDSAELEVGLRNLTAEYADKNVAQYDCLPRLIKEVNGKPLDQVLSKTEETVEKIIQPSLRDFAMDLSEHIAADAAIPAAAQSLIKSLSELKLILAFRVNVLIQILARCPGLVPKDTRLAIEAILDDLVSVDTMAEDAEMWVRVYKWLLAPPAGKDDKDSVAIQEELNHRVENINLMLNPTHADQTFDDTEEGEPSGASSKSATPSKKRTLTSLLRVVGQHTLKLKSTSKNAGVEIHLRAVLDLIAQANARFREHLSSNSDIGYSHLAVAKFADKETSKPWLAALRPNKTEISLAFGGDVGYTPKVGSLKCFLFSGSHCTLRLQRMCPQARSTLHGWCRKDLNGRRRPTPGKAPPNQRHTRTST